ncbi:MAG: Rieske (2Fe-2S) protein, partial [Bacteroidota bacterium]
MNKTFEQFVDPVLLYDLTDLPLNAPKYGLVENTDLVVTRYQENQVSVLYGRCLHRGALLADGHIDGHNLICGVHNWDYRVDTGVSEYNNAEVLHKFPEAIENGKVYIDRVDIIAYEELHPQPFDRNAYQGLYADTHPESTEPY